MSPDALQQLRMLTAKLVCQWVRSGRTPTMKCHVTAQHLALQMAITGNCAWTHNYSDESCNFETRVRGSSCHRLAHSHLFLCKWYLDFLNEKIGAV